MRLPLFALAMSAVFALTPALAHADVEHVVKPGQTLSGIANRYQVSVKSIVDKNRIRDEKGLQLGQVLVIPGVGGKGLPKKPGAAANANTDRYAAKPKSPGVVRVARLGNPEQIVLNLGRGSKVPAAAATRAKKLWSQGDQTHKVEPRLLLLLRTVSDHFGGRPIDIISGYRPFKKTQYTKDSRHNHGSAVDFRVRGVPNKIVVDYCKTLKNTGCGYYPNSVFVHMDARERNETWVDYSRPGEKPQYKKPAASPDLVASESGSSEDSDSPMIGTTSEPKAAQ